MKKKIYIIFINMVMSLIKKAVKKVQKLPKKQRYVVYAVILYALYKLVQEIRFGFFNQYSMIEGLSSGNKLVLFHMKGCPHCVNMMPEWDKFAKLNPGQTAKHEASDVQELTNKLKITGFPTIMLLDRQNNKIKAYDGGRTANEFKAFITQN
jgi:thiol-disulfide isomerase/thioredoxin